MADAAALLKVTFEEGAIVVNDQEEYLLDAGQELKSVGDVVQFLEAQEKFKGKTIVPFSAKQRVIASKTGAASAVAFIKVENQAPMMTTTPGDYLSLIIFKFVAYKFFFLASPPASPRPAVASASTPAPLSPRAAAQAPPPSLAPAPLSPRLPATTPSPAYVIHRAAQPSI